MNLTWICKNFDELTTLELYAILRVRCEVFVVEQNCVYQDIDGKDLTSLHLMAFDGDVLAAYCRILPAGLSFEEASIGRVITSPTYRGEGIGVSLIERAIVETANAFGSKQIKIGAQLYLKKFYERFGFEPTSEIYVEDGIEHVDMVLNSLL